MFSGNVFRKRNLGNENQWNTSFSKPQCFGCVFGLGMLSMKMQKPSRNRSRKEREYRLFYSTCCKLVGSSGKVDPFFVFCDVWRMGSMADSTTPEKTAEATEGLDQAVPVLEGSMPGTEGLPASMPDPHSPEGKGDQPDEADLEVLEPPGKKIRFSLEESFTKLMDRTQEGFDLTRGALEKVQLHLDLSKKVSQDLSQLARAVHCEKIGAKYQLAQLQQVLSSFQNLEWQVGGPKSEANTSLKSISNKILGAQTACKEGLKTLHGEMRDGNERIVQAITDGFNKLSAAMVANAPPVKEASAPAYPPVPPPTMPPGTAPAGSGGVTTYGLPGYASSFGMPTSNVPMVHTPQTPARVPPTSTGSMGSVPTAPAVATAARNEPQPPMVLLVADESGAPRRVAVSPTRHLSSNNLSQSYLQEFGLGCVHHAGGYHRRLPDVFLPKWTWGATARGIWTVTFWDRSCLVREAI